jgi:hypothetical protein
MHETENCPRKKTLHRGDSQPCPMIMPWALAERMDIELITGKDAAFLDSQQFPIVINALLVAEASQNRVPLLDLTVTSQTTDPDGGIDAHFLWPTNIQHDVLAPGANILQFKAGKISKELLTKEFSKPDIRVLRTGSLPVHTPMGCSPIGRGR